MLTKFGWDGAQIVGSVFADAVMVFIKTNVWGGVTLSLSGISGVLVLVQLYAFLLGHLMLYVNSPNGVWIQGNWPFPIPGVNFPYIWAIGR